MSGVERTAGSLTTSRVNPDMKRPELLTPIRQRRIAGGMVLTAVFAGMATFAWSQAKVAHYGSAAIMTTQSARVLPAVDTRPASATLQRGLTALDRRDMPTALSARQQLKLGTLERKLLAWAIAMRGDGVDVATLSSIAEDLPDWPGAARMRHNIEDALAKSMSGDALRLAFGNAVPVTAAVAEKLAEAHMKAGDRKAARQAIANLWRNTTLSRNAQARIVKKFGKVLTRDDHRARLEYLLAKRRLNDAERIAGLAGATRMTAARIAVERKRRDAGKKIDAIPAFQKDDANALFSKARWLRRQDRITQAADTLLRAKSVHQAAGDRYWTEQRIVASDLLEAGKPETAYKLVSKPFATSAGKQVDAAFYAGWIALRKLKSPAKAEQHFRDLLKIATRPLSKSRGHYWLARALKSAGHNTDANAHFAKAAHFDTTYYGQLAAREIGRSAISVSKARPSRSERARFAKYELVQAIAKLESAGHHGYARWFYRHLGRQLDRPGELALLSAQAEKKGDHPLALRIGKNAFARGAEVDNLAWPIGAIPRSTKTGKVGLALAYAIARQESTFQIDARSPANALGLMQLIPSTARNTARKIGMKYSRSRLTTDAAYNARLGTAYLDLQMNRFNGSYILTFVGYNAGPLRSEQWIERFGDPRGAPLYTVIDWVETIPYSETRNYVQRVMENYQVYRARLNGKGLTIDKDLRRGNRT